MSWQPQEWMVGLTGSLRKLAQVLAELADDRGHVQITYPQLREALRERGLSAATYAADFDTLKRLRYVHTAQKGSRQQGRATDYALRSPNGAVVTSKAPTGDRSPGIE